MNKPDWWPQNPYPSDIFTMTEAEYVKIISDPRLRTRISGFLGRLFWDVASDSICQAWQNHILEDIKE